MAEEAALRRQLDTQRAQLDDTIDQIGERVIPGRVIQRKRNQFRNQWTDWKDRVMGNDEPSYAGQTGSHNRMGSAMDAAKEQTSSAAAAVGETPKMMRRKTRGNPAAAGVIAFGAGLLAAAIIPETEKEHRAVQRIQPDIESAAAGLADTGRETAEHLKEPAREAAESVKESARS
jgi:hypothetical protein